MEPKFALKKTKAEPKAEPKTDERDDDDDDAEAALGADMVPVQVIGEVSRAVVDGVSHTLRSEI